MTALHDGTCPTLQFIGRLSVCTIERLRKTVGDVVEIGIWVGRWCINSRHLTVCGFLLSPSRHKLLSLLPAFLQLVCQRAPHLRQQAIGDKVVEIIWDLHLRTDIDGITQFGKLADDILTRRFLSLLMFCCETYRQRCGSRRLREDDSRQLKALSHSLQGDTNGNTTLSTGLSQQTLELLVTVPVEPHPSLQPLGHTIGIDAISHYPIGTEPFELMTIIETKAVAIGKTRDTCDIEGVWAQFLDGTNKFAHCLWRIKGGNIRLAPMKEIGGITAIERLAEIWGKRITAYPQRTAAILIGIAADDPIELLAIGSCHILHIGDIFQTTFNLKRSGSSLSQFQQMIALIQILEGEQIAIVLHLSAIGIHKRERHAAELGTGTSIGTPSETMLRGIADARVTDAQSPVDEHLEFHIRHLTMDRRNLLQREFTGKHGSHEALLTQPAHLLDTPVIRLRGSMKRQLTHREDGHILHQDGIHTSLAQFAQQLAGGIQFLVIDNGIDGDIDLRAEAMGIVTKLTNIIDAVAYSCSRSKTGSTDIDCISPMVYGSYATGQILGRS